MKTHKWPRAIFALALLTLLPLSAAAQTRHLTVVFNSEALPPDAHAIIEAAGGTVVATVPEIGVMTIEGSAALIDTLSFNPAIAAIGPELTIGVRDGTVIDNLTEASSADVSTANRYLKYQWDIKQVTNNGASFGVRSGSHNTVVAIVDTGINTKHLDLIPNYLGGLNFVGVGGSNRNNPDPLETGDPNQVEDRNGHGSHIAGTIAGKGEILGVGPNLGYRAYRVLDANGHGLESWILRGIVAAVQDGVDVISVSICGVDLMAGGFWTDPDTGIRYRFRSIPSFLALRRAIQYAAQNGIVVVAAAGNDAVNIANPAELTAYLNRIHGAEGWEVIGASREVPALVPGIVTVSATSRKYSLASYSNYGPGAIDMTAPGGDYLASRRIADLCYSAYMDFGDGYDYYAWMEGTSMATPKVAAVAALIIDQAKSAGVRLTAAQVITRLQQTAIDIGKGGADQYFGHGFVSAYDALSAKSRR